MKTIVRRLTVGYVRSATKNDLSVKSQEKEIRKYCKKFGYFLNKIYSDNGYSGAILDRPGFSKLISEILKANIAQVVCLDPSRISRDTMQLLVIKNLFKNCETELIFVNGTNAFNDIHSGVVEEIMTVINSLEPRLNVYRKTRNHKGKQS